MNRRRNVITGHRARYPNSMAMAFRLVPALVLAVVCGGYVVDAAVNELQLIMMNKNCCLFVEAIGACDSSCSASLCCC